MPKLSIPHQEEEDCLEEGRNHTFRDQTDFGLLFCFVALGWLL